MNLIQKNGLSPALQRKFLRAFRLALFCVTLGLLAPAVRAAPEITISAPSVARTNTGRSALP